MITDLIAGVAVVTGSALMALGAFGLLRFPDVFTRMHSATKVATVGVIATTAAASLETQGFTGVLVLVLVVALLFLTAPMGMSLLARAAYHDPETPRRATTLTSAPQPSDVTATSPPRRRGSGRVLTVWLFVVWVALFGSLAPHVIVSGIIVAAVTAWLLRGLAPRWTRAFVRPVAATRFVVYFCRRLVASTWNVITSLRMPPDAIAPAIVEVSLRVRTRAAVTLLMNSISFTPGTVALDVEGWTMSVHVLTTADPDAIVQDIRDLEDRILASLQAVPEHDRAPGSP